MKRSFKEARDVVRRTKKERDEQFYGKLIARMSELRDRKFHGDMILRFGDGGITLMEMHERIKPDDF